MSLQKILKDLSDEVSRISYQGSNHIVARISVPKKVVEALNDELYPKERSGTVKGVDIKSIHFDSGIIEIETL